MLNICAIDLLAILQKEPGSSDISIQFYTRGSIEVRSQLCTFENSTNYNEISLDQHSS